MRNGRALGYCSEGYRTSSRQKSAPVGRMDGCAIHLEGAALRWTYLSVPDEKTSVPRV